MHIREVNYEEYAAAPLRHAHVYNTAAFAKLNEQKADSVSCLLIDDGHHMRFGIVLGRRGEWLLSPFSAPFGGLSAAREQGITQVEEALDAVIAYTKERGLRLRVTLPPLFYSQQLEAETVNVLSRRGQIHHIDLNYHFPLTLFDHYQDAIARNARKNLKHALSEDFEFIAVERGDRAGLEAAYGVISRNRAEHGYPLRMTLDDVMRTVRLIPADFFILRHEGEPVAAAQVFHVADGIAQVIYWGDLRQYSAMRPMNALTYRLFEHYRQTDVHTLDIGPSTEDGIPNYGLCDFKTGIGCVASPKFVFEV